MTIRPARPDDYPAFSRLFAELGTGDTVPPLAWWSAEAAPRSLVAEENGEVVGYCFVDAFGEAAHVSQLAISPEFRGRGLGRRLMLAHAERLRSEGCTRWQLNVKHDNAPAIHLYESLGFRTAKRTFGFVAPWSVIADLQRNTGDLRVRALAAEEEPEAEKQFDLAPGLLARRRAGARLTHVLALVPADAERPLLGLATFTPSMPGTKPFQLADAAYGPALLAGIAGLREGDLPLHIGLENEGFAQTLVAAGATLKFTALHMRGPLPG